MAVADPLEHKYRSREEAVSQDVCCFLINMLYSSSGLVGLVVHLASGRCS